jgi:predicted metal-dependent peptidase
MSWIMSAHDWKDVEEDAIAQEFMKDVVRKAKDMCGKQYGNIPGQVLEQIEDLLKTKKPVVPWARVLRMFCASSQESVLDWTLKRASKRFGTRPGTRKGDVLNLAVIVDTSGSISDEQLKLFFNEIYWVHKNGAIVTVIEADADVTAIYPYKGKWNGRVHGRGGTDLEPALIEVEKKYDAAIYFTDFYAPEVSRRYRIPTLWVLTTEYDKDEYPYPWGRHIKIEDMKAIPA